MKIKLAVSIIVVVAIMLLILPALRSRSGDMPIKRTDVELRDLQIACRAFSEAYGTLPTGTVSAICRSLAGDNPKRIIFIQFHKDCLSPDGSFLDPWGTPYRIRLADSNILVGSAGKDRKWETADDIKKE